jgi:serine/threonine-protein kinase
MVSTDPNVASLKITDFGIAKMAEAEIQEAMKDNDEESMLSSATVVGALPYMAPEVIQNKENVSDRADIWSCGAILYQLLTGYRPFGDGIQAVANILGGKLPPIPAQLTSNQQFKQLTGELWSLIADCLSPTPDVRPSAKDLVERCGRLCYSTAPRLLGRVKNYKSYKGDWGFIVCDGDNDEVFFHGSSCWGGAITAGARVSLARFSGSPQARGYPVLCLRI